MNLADFAKTLLHIEGETTYEWLSRLEAAHVQATERARLAETNSVRLSATLEEHLAAARETSEALAQVLAVETAAGWAKLHQNADDSVIDGLALRAAFPTAFDDIPF